MKRTYYLILREDGQFRKMKYDKEKMTITIGWTYDEKEAKMFDRWVDAVMAKRSCETKTACSIVSRTIEI